MTGWAGKLLRKPLWAGAIPAVLVLKEFVLSFEERLKAIPFPAASPASGTELFPFRSPLPPPPSEV